MKTLALRVLLPAMLLQFACAAHAQESPPPGTASPRIEVVFVLDTTGSMGGLIQGAKERIWAIANALATVKPTPRIAMGLLGYRDRGDDYVTKITDLTDDLDAVYSNLMAFEAGGGGDSPESVNQALHEAVTKIKWATDDKTFRVIYLVGDCPPHMDYQDDVKYTDTCKLAIKAGIIINTIQCGNHGPTTPIWQDIADRSEGAYFQVEQSGGVVAIATPFDKEMAELSAALEGTRIYYGTSDEREALAKRTDRSDEIRSKAPAAAVAERAAFISGEAGAKSFAGDKELLSDLDHGKAKLGEIDDNLLPDRVRKMSLEERKTFFATELARRKNLQAKITALQAERRAYLEKKLAEKGEPHKDSFETAILDSLAKQADGKGIFHMERDPRITD